MMLNDVKYKTFTMFVTEMNKYLFVISFQLMFYKALRCRLARALLPKNEQVLIKPNQTEKGR